MVLSRAALILYSIIMISSTRGLSRHIRVPASVARTWSTRMASSSADDVEAPSSAAALYNNNTKLKGLLVGSGSDGMSDPQVTSAILDLVPHKAPSAVNVLYLGTATYDLPGPQQKQTERLVEAGCTIQSLKLVANAPSNADMRVAVEAADVIVVSGGNTLYAVDRWTRLGLHQMLRQSMLRGAVLTGGSAGAICWFQGSHSDSMDPDTYKGAMLCAAATDDDDDDKGSDESSVAPVVSQEKKPWDYIRVDGLGFLPGLVCPHYDKTQSNGVLRATDFDAMLLRHPGEFGIGIDHWAALQVANGCFQVLSLPGKPGSVLLNDTFSHEQKGKPGVWLKEVRDGRVHTTLCPAAGKIEDLLRTPTEILSDPRVELCRQANPDDGPVLNE
jgi:dipeptidase E